MTPARAQTQTTQSGVLCIIIKPCSNGKCLVITHNPTCCTEWQTVSNMFDHRPNKMFYILRSNFCRHSNFIKHFKTRCVTRKMFGHQMFDHQSLIVFNRRTISVWTGLNVHIEWSRFWARLKHKVNIVKVCGKKMSVTKQLSPQFHTKT